MCIIPQRTDGNPSISMNKMTDLFYKIRIFLKKLKTIDKNSQNINVSKIKKFLILNNINFFSFKNWIIIIQGDSYIVVTLSPINIFIFSTSKDYFPKKNQKMIFLQNKNIYGEK